MVTQISELKAGDGAPDFSAVDQQGLKHSLNSYRGKSVVLYFYPKDDTPGCTKEACDFRDNYQRFVKKGAVILGVSPDGALSHQKFITKFKLPFPLLVDEDKSISKAYGVWKEKSMYGRKYMGIERSTFVIDPGGKIKQAIRKVGVPGHAQQMLGAL